jgi:hypothetical protein
MLTARGSKLGTPAFTLVTTTHLLVAPRDEVGPYTKAHQLAVRRLEITRVENRMSSG